MSSDTSDEPLASCGTCTWWEKAQGGYADPHGYCHWGEKNKAPEWAKVPQFRLHYQGEDCVMHIAGKSLFTR